MGSTFPAQSSYEARAVSLGRDVIAGFTMACVSIPQIIAYSDMAGFPGSRGLLTAGPAMMVFGVFTGHPWLSQGVTSASAIMAKEDLHGDEFVKLHGTQSYADLMSLYTVLIGMASVAIALSGFANIVKRIPRPAFIGFAWGARFTVLSNQLPEMLFARGRSFSAMVCKDAVLMVPSYMNGAKRAATLACSLAHPSLWESSTLAFASAATLALILGKHFIPARFPKGAEILAVLVSATLVSTLCRYGDWGNVVGAIPLKNRGFTRTFAAPFQVNLNLPYDEIPGKACQALFFAVINFTSTVSICATYEASGQPWDPRRELLAQGASCIAAGFTGSPPFAASFSRSDKTAIDRPLLIGAGLFGVGWGVGGLCPGPGVASLLLTPEKAGGFVASPLDSRDRRHLPPVSAALKFRENLVRGQVSQVLSMAQSSPFFYQLQFC